MSRNVLITGGAGYIGSVVARSFIARGDNVIIIDDLSHSTTHSIPKDCIFYNSNINNKDVIKEITSKYEISACLHFAAFIEVGESVKDPYKYFNNNTSYSIELFNNLQNCGVNKVVFSSTAAIYGEPIYTPIDENHPKNPANPYGLSKYFIEKFLESFSIAYDFNYVALRYFNACGADSINYGEDHNPESHLIPLILQVPLNKREKIFIYGNDYPTKDGTCIRDYIHVSDLASAHLAAYDYLISGGKSDVFNLGNGNGFSVQEVIDCARKVTGHNIPQEVVERRAGDTSVLVASSQKAKDILKWQPKYYLIEDMVKSAWDWHKNNPNGYNK